MRLAECFSTFRQTFELPSSKFTLTLKMVYSVLSEMSQAFKIVRCLLPKAEDFSLVTFSLEKTEATRNISRIGFPTQRVFALQNFGFMGFITKRISWARFLTRERTRSSVILSEQKQGRENVNGRKQTQLKPSQIPTRSALACSF